MELCACAAQSLSRCSSSVVSIARCSTSYGRTPVCRVGPMRLLSLGSFSESHRRLGPFHLWEKNELSQNSQNCSSRASTRIVASLDDSAKPQKEQEPNIDNLWAEFDDDTEDELQTYLNLELESDLDIDTYRHYEIMCIIHEKNADEVQAVIDKVTETQKFRPRSFREEKEDPVISTECISKPLSNVPVSDIRGGVVALGKFDALHIGHRALAEQAARMGPPVLLSFAGMGEVLGWAPRLPVAALCDRKRIMSIWANRCGGVIPQEYALDFTKVRSLSPEEFVKKLATELQVSGVVAGANYRFGYKAAGDASDLVHLCNEHGLQAFIVDPVMDTSEVDVKKDKMSGSSREKGQVSSTRVRKALAKGDLERVASLLGRKHRLVLSLENARQEGEVLIVPLKDALNQGPREGCYDCTVVKTGEPRDAISTTGQLDVADEFIGVGQVKIGLQNVEVSLRDNDVEQMLRRTLLGLEFPYG